MNTIIIGGAILFVLFLVVFVYVFRKEGFWPAMGASALVVAIAFIPVGIWAQNRRNTRAVTEEMTSVIQRVDHRKVLLKDEVQMRMVATDVMLEEGDEITYQLTESGYVVIKKLETH